MNPGESRFHLCLALVWIGMGVWIAIAIAVASGEKTALERKRGLDHKERRELSVQQDKLRAEIDWLASAPSLDQAVNRLGLPLQPPSKVASR
ncbi:MAG: hypothetical protein J0M02_01180 [Planctomycetes bacterium]|nr:hypothetical protein [Planctomycetota bacterium]